MTNTQFIWPRTSWGALISIALTNYGNKDFLYRLTLYLLFKFKATLYKKSLI